MTCKLCSARFKILSHAKSIWCQIGLTRVKQSLRPHVAVNPRESPHHRLWLILKGHLIYQYIHMYMAIGFISHGSLHTLLVQITKLIYLFIFLCSSSLMTSQQQCFYVPLVCSEEQMYVENVL
jgi:hypothetical protein